MIYEVSTYREGKEHWTEITLEDEGGGVFELSIVGCTTHDEEWEMTKSRLCEGPEEVVKALRDNRGRLSIPAMELLRKAGIDAGSGT